ncbi:hypothetical protein Trydic_g2159 [Trypoxylus dichotomus]
MNLAAKSLQLQEVTTDLASSDPRLTVKMIEVQKADADECVEKWDDIPEEKLNNYVREYQSADITSVRSTLLHSPESLHTHFANFTHY